MAQAVPNLCVSVNFFLKHQINWITVCGAIHGLTYRNIWSTVCGAIQGLTLTFGLLTILLRF